MGVLAQCTRPKQGEGMDAQFACPNVGRSSWKNTKRGFRADQPGCCLSGCSIASNGKNSAKIFLGSHECQLGCMPAVDRFCHFHPPPMVIEGANNTTNKKTYR